MILKRPNNLNMPKMKLDEFKKSGLRDVYTKKMMPVNIN